MNVPHAMLPAKSFGATPVFIVRADADLEGKIQKMIAEQLSVDEGKITPGSSFVDLGADSLDTVELLMALEEEFGVEIPEDEAQKLTPSRQSLITPSLRENKDSLVPRPKCL